MATYQKEHFEIEKDIGELAFFFQGGDVAYIWTLFYRRHWNFGEVIHKNNTNICSYLSCDRIANETRLYLSCIQRFIGDVLVYDPVKARCSTTLATSETSGSSPVSILGRETTRCHIEFGFCQMVVKEWSYILWYSLW